uniref:Uncharacterized protein LOC104249492 n=1 Tax=Nicotiana sylvestris TaxID=4096 RepID=A0A1U7YYK0_NICSY|nr:PREDICTED: uncharacterized protein LOC104249492 [Nicotiana sylvestris]
MRRFKDFPKVINSNLFSIHPHNSRRISFENKKPSVVSFDFSSWSFNFNAKLLFSCSNNLHQFHTYFTSIHLLSGLSPCKSMVAIVEMTGDRVEVNVNENRQEKAIWFYILVE